jgi:signal peptidase I
MAEGTSDGTPSQERPTTTSENTPPADQKSRRQWIIENVTSLGLALLIVFMIRSSVVEAFKIPSGSMIPTLLIGDHIFVNKFAYGFKIPFSDIVTDHPVYVVKRDPPQHGDIIVFMYPKDESIYYIKRVIGLPGDKIEVRNKVLYLNDKQVPRELVQGPAADKIFHSLDEPKYSASNLDLYTEHLDHVDHPILLDKNNFMGESYGPVTVPPDSLFVMGDNRDFSNDSRFWGFVPMRNVKGRAFVIWLSLWMSFSDGQFMFRPDRIGTVLH